LHGYLGLGLQSVLLQPVSTVSGGDNGTEKLLNQDFRLVTLPKKFSDYDEFISFLLLNNKKVIFKLTLKKLNILI